MSEPQPVITPKIEAINSYWEEHLAKLEDSRLKRIVKLAENDVYNIAIKGGQTRAVTFIPITIAENDQMETLRKAFHNEKDRSMITTRLMEIYLKGAELFFKLEREDVRNNFIWADLKDAIDACVYRTINGKPNL